MKISILLSTIMLAFAGGAVFAQSGGDVRVQPGFFCAQNKCVRFSRDLSQVSVQGRRPASVVDYGLRSNPVISIEAFREIFFLALRQPGVHGNRS